VVMVGCGGWKEHQEEVKEVAGGYLCVSVGSLAESWEAYRQKAIPLLGLRAYLVLHEIEHRRGRAKWREFGVDEIWALVGKPNRESLRRALKALRQAELVRATPRQIIFSKKLRYAEELLRELKRGPGSKIPIARRLLKRLARSGTRLEFATVFGTLIRCNRSSGEDGIRSGGRCSSRWIEDVFRVSAAEVTRCRQQLEREGWLYLIRDDNHQAVQRHGGSYVLSMVNIPGGEKVARRRITPATERKRLQITPPLDNKSPLSKGESKHQKPADHRPAGVCTQDFPDPDLNNITTADLRSVPRLLELHRQGVKRGWSDEGHISTLNWVAAAQRMVRVTRIENPPAAFRRVVEKNFYRVISEQDEVAAARALKKFYRTHEAVPEIVSRLMGGCEKPVFQERSIEEQRALPMEELAQYKLEWARARRAA